MSSGWSDPAQPPASVGLRDEPEPARSEARPGPPLWALLAAPLLASVALVVVSAPRLDAPFSPAFTDFNTAVWATGSQAVRTDGWGATRLGATAGPSGAEVPYAHHPPLVRVEVTLAEQVLGAQRWVDRLPALLSSLAAIWWCWGWLGACRFRPGPRSLGVLAVGGTGAMLTYGAMLNMEAIWLPLAFGLLWAWQRAERCGGGAVSCFLVAVLGCTAAHQGMLLAGSLAVLGVVQARRERRRLRPHERAVLAGAALGAALFVLWVLWASGSVADLVRIAGERSGDGVGWGEFVVAQADHLVLLFGLAGIVCLVAGLALVKERPDLRGQLVVVWAVALAYAVVFRQGATIHPYWNAALLPAVALGGALAGDRLAQRGRRALQIGLAAVAVLLLVASVAAYREGSPGRDAGEVARVAAERGEGTLRSTEIVSEWVTYESGRPVRPAYDCESVLDAASSDATADVVTSRRWIELQDANGWAGVAASPESQVRGDFAVTTLGVLSSVCPSG
jgi:hypothetical protein